MTGSNLPPGVSVNDLPGNTPADIAEEEFWDALDAKLRNDHPEVAAEVDDLWDEYEDMFIVVAREARELGYNAGYGDGQAEASMGEEC